MHKAADILAKRMDELTRPEPTITIFNGHEHYVTDTGEMGARKEISVKLSVRFRESQLAQLKGPILGVFLCIALHINEKGQAWPSIKLIAHETGYNKDTVYRCLHKLEQRGYISRVQRPSGELGKFRSNTYQLFPKSRRLTGK